MVSACSPQSDAPVYRSGSTQQNLRGNIRGREYVMVVIGEITMAEQPITDDLHLLLNVLPPHLREPLEQHALIDNLLEVILDLGREPEARFPGSYATISDTPVTEEDIEYVVARVGDVRR